MASCSDDNTVKFWDLTSRTCVRTCYGHTATVHTVDFHPNGFCLASGSSDETIRVWDLRMKRTLQVHEGEKTSPFLKRRNFIAFLLKRIPVK